MSEIHKDKDLGWPKFDSRILETEEIKFVVQINGKKRALLNVRKDISEKKLIEVINKDKNLNKHFDINQIKKIIFIKNRLINILLNE